MTMGFDVNSSMVLCFNELGCGEAALRKFSAIMAIPGLAHNTYRQLSKKVGRAHTAVTANVLTAAVHAVRDMYMPDQGEYAPVHDTDEENGSSTDSDCDGEGDGGDQDSDDGDGGEGGDGGGGGGDGGGGADEDAGDGDDGDGDGGGGADEGDGDGGGADEDGDGDSSDVGDNGVGDGDDSDHGNQDDVVDVTVSFDGTWHKRGFTSNYGVGIIIDVATGLVLSKYCQACTLNDKKNMTALERWLWRGQHAAVCDANYEGSSKGMEKEAALRMWRRSIQKNGMRYTKMLSDGDSVAYKAVCDEGLYPVEKLECLNHCDKRMGKALCKKAKEAKLGGRRCGAVTAKSCNTLQSYYHNVIVQNLGSPAKMREAIWASFLHCTSSDENPQHQNCPQGSDSWCFYNRSTANNERPPAHMDSIGTPLSQDVARAIRPIYDRMSSLPLMNRIEHGRTQNANESVNGMIWARCPKTVHVGAGRINAAVASAVSHFNQGCAHLAQVMKHIGSVLQLCCR